MKDHIDAAKQVFHSVVLPDIDDLEPKILLD
jgi:hypothetical protein